jgi:integrase
VSSKKPPPGRSQENSAGGVSDVVEYLLKLHREGSAVIRYQDPKIERRTDGKRDYWFIRPYIPVVTPQGTVRKQKRVPLGFCDAMTLKQARVAKSEYMTPINAGKFFLQAQLLFEAVVQKYRETVVPTLAASTQAKYTGFLNNRILPAFGKLELAKVDTPAVQILINQASTLGWYAKHDLRNTISAVFSYAKQVGLWSGANPCKGVRMGRKTTVRKKQIPTDAEVDAFLAALPDTKICTADQARLLVLVAVMTGLRVSEILGLQVRDLDLERQTLQVERGWVRGNLGGTKTENSRRVRQIGPLALALAQQAAGKLPEAFLFARENGLPPDSRDLQQHVFRPAAEQVGIYFQGFGMHTFRRLNISWRQEVGAHPLEAMKAAGHGSLGMTWLYTVLDAGREQEQMRRMWDRLLPPPSGPKQ